MKLYLAGQYRQKDELAAVAEQLRAAGHTIIARWLDEPHAPTTTLDQVDEDQLCEYAIQDLEDIEACEIFVFFSVAPDVPTVRGGRHVEFGFALGSNKHVIVVGEKENIFHYLPLVITHVEDIEDLQALLAVWDRVNQPLR